MAKPRITGHRPCHTLGCAELTVERSRFCRRCNELRDTPLDPPLQAGDQEVERFLLAEKKQGGGKWTKLVRRYGTHPCHNCEGAALPGRLYCSEPCRTKARQGRANRMELDGIEDTPLEHARRLSIPKGTFYERIRSGYTAVEALTWDRWKGAA